MFLVSLICCLTFSIIPLTISAIISAKLQASESTVVGYSGIVRVGSLLILIAILGSMFDLIGLAISVLLSTIFYSIFLKDICLCHVIQKNMKLIFY